MNTLSIYGVAVHELTHLSGSQDVLYFTLDRALRDLGSVQVPGSSLRQGPFSKKGDYFEEGLASLVHSMYYWDLGESILGNKTEVYKSPSGQILHMPQRISNVLAGHHEYAHCAWGVERLVDMAPEVWNILIASRRYGARSQGIRSALHQCIDYAAPGLFHHIDNTNTESLDEMMDVTARIDHTARRNRR